MKNRIIAGLLALILGVVGAHRFYLKDYGGGIFYIFLLFITSRISFPVTGILGVLEAIRIFNMSNEEFDRKYNREYIRERQRSGEKEYVRDIGNESRSSRRKTRTHKNTREVPVRRRRKKSIFSKRNPFKKSAKEKYEEYDFKGAVSEYKKALDIEPDDPDLHFEIGTVYSLLENKNLAFRHLDTAVRLGLKEPQKIDTHEDLAFVRIQPEFEEFKQNNYILTKKSLGPAKSDLLDDDLLLSQLNKLSELRKKGILSEEEFSMEKEKLMELKK